MVTLYLPYTLAVHGPLSSEAAFCTSISNKLIAFTSVHKVFNFIEQAQKLLGIKLEWGVANNVEFPGLDIVEFELDPLIGPYTA